MLPGCRGARRRRPLLAGDASRTIAAFPERRSVPCRPAANSPMPSAPCPWMPYRRPIPVIRAPRWAWPTSPRCCGGDVLKHNPGNPLWWDRDRFVLSNGHASMLLYAVLHLTGYPLPIEELRNFRQLAAPRPRATRSTSCTSASRPPPGRSARASPTRVGMALAERTLAAQFNRPGLPSSITTPTCSAATAA